MSEGDNDSRFTKIDEGIEEFCTKLLNFYGKGSLTPNMHLAGHITDYT